MDPSPPPSLKPQPVAAARRRQLPVWLRAWPVYMVAIAVVVGTVYVTRMRQQSGQLDPVLPAAVQLEQNIEVKFGEVTMQGRQKGVQRWIISSPTVALSKDGRYTYFDPKPRGRFLNLKDWRAKEGEPAEKVRSLDWNADRATFDSFTEDLEMEGHALITTDEKDVIRTERVEYKSRTKRVHMPKPVTIKMVDGTDVKADSLEANTDAEIFELRGHVDFRTKANDEDKL